jgi:hypothetical protein
MAADDFFARWSKRKAEAVRSPATLDLAIDPVADDALLDSNPPAVIKPLPTLADVEGLTAESDYAAFVAKGVDETVKRSAMKKLFALPQFNIMDGLDIYTGDYSQPDPLPPGMLEALVHARDALNPAQFFDKQVSQLLDRVTDAERQPAPLSPILDEAVEALENPAPALPQEVIEPAPQPVPMPAPEALPSAIEMHATDETTQQTPHEIQKKNETV